MDDDEEFWANLNVEALLAQTRQNPSRRSCFKLLNMDQGA